MTTPNTDELRGQLVDQTDVGIIISDYMGLEWNGNMRDDIVEMVNAKHNALISKLISEISPVVESRMLQASYTANETQLDIATKQLVRDITLLLENHQTPHIKELYEIH